ncbi:hypothetical protein [Streptomyces sp. NPDC001307]|uniref:hypothetical protein n=1 Tax=Streptomyces sp. NPDC001307 TaxID=3364560 RepID=UPI0036894A6E
MRGIPLPAERWVHLRTTNPIESTFSTVKLRTKVTRGAGSPAAALATRREWAGLLAPPSGLGRPSIDRTATEQARG